MTLLNNPQGWLLEYARYWPHRGPVTIIQGGFRRPEDILEELRKADPDAHANLTEHLVVPKDER